MAFDDLARVGISELVERQRERSSLWGFVHVPKTAGTSLIAALRSVCRPHRNIVPRTYLVSNEEFKALTWDAVNEFVQFQTEAIEAHKAKWFSGHLQRLYADHIVEALPGTRLFTFVRDPVEQIISDYRYCLTPRHPTHEKFSEQYPTLMDFVTDVNRANSMTSYLMKNHATQKTTAEEVIESVTGRFQFIGIANHYEPCVSIICSMLGVNDVTPDRRNVTADTAENTVEVTSEIIDAIRNLHALDEALYRHVQQVLVPRLDEWISVSSPSRAS